MRIVSYAGVSRENGELKFHGSTRANFEEVRHSRGDTDITIRKLPRPMSKKEAAQFLIKEPEFQSAEVIECLTKALQTLRGDAVDEGADSAGAEQTRGDRLKIAREKRGLAIAEVAQRLGLSKEAVWAQEARNHMPRDGKLADYAALYRVRESWLREGGDAGADEGAGHFETQSKNTISEMSGAELLALARKKLAAENKVAETCVSIDVSIRLAAGS